MVQGWDNWTGPNLDDETLLGLSKLPYLEQLHMLYCGASINTLTFFGEFPKLKRLYTLYLCCDEASMLDDLRGQYSETEFVFYDSNHGGPEVPEPTVDAQLTDESRFGS